MSSVLSATWSVTKVFAIALVVGFIVNHRLSSYIEGGLRRAQSEDPTLRYVTVKSSPVPLQVRSEVVGKRIGTFFHIPGAGCTWLFNAVPFWPLPERLPGVEFVSFSRQGFPFTSTEANNATAADVEVLARQVVEMIEQIADPSLPLWISGHSYGGLQASLVAKKLIEANRRPAAVILVDASPVFLPEFSELQATWNAAASKLSGVFRVMAYAASVGLLRILRSPLLALSAPTALENVPEQYRDAYLFAFAAPSTYGSLKADFDRYFPTADALRKLAGESNAPLLGDVRLEMVQASPQRFMKDGPVSQEVMDILEAHNSRSLFATLSSRTNIRVIDEADHQFVSTPKAVRGLQDAIVEIVQSSL